nr:MAG TPA: ChiA1-BD-binding domain protein [Caudoviricetes sp.]
MSSLKEIFEQVIQLGNYDLKPLLDRIDQYHIEGRLTDEERLDLIMQARKGAEPEYDYAGEIDALWAAVRALQQNVSPPTEEDEWPEFVQPIGAGTAYQVGDKITFRGERYICILAHCVWSPADYPAGWQKQA